MIGQKTDAFSRGGFHHRIQVLFSIADLDAPSENAEMRPAEEEDMEPEEAESEEPSFPVRTAITVSKGAGQGGLTVDAVAEDGLFVIDAVSFYKDEQQALDMSAEGDWKRRALYMGPEVLHPCSFHPSSGIPLADALPLQCHTV